MGQPNWAKLKEEGRVKDIGISWNEEELKALYEEKIPADYVREGILTKEDYAKALEQEAKDGKKSIAKMSKEDLMSEAVQLGVKVTPDASKESLVKAITKANDRILSKAEQELAVAKALKKEQEFQAKQAAAQQKAVDKELKKKDE
jgi:hypothetical protein